MKIQLAYEDEARWRHFDGDATSHTPHIECANKQVHRASHEESERIIRMMLPAEE